MATAAAAASENTAGVSRREFLYYIWGASIVVFTAQFTGLLVWFMLPRFREGEFGGLFPLSVDVLPSVNTPPVVQSDGRFWLVNVDSGTPNRLMFQADDESQPIKGVIAIYTVCTHLGCIYDWNSANDRFECPCHGSKYRLDGRRYQNPAPRSLDRMVIQAFNASGVMVAESATDAAGEVMPLELPADTVEIRVDTGQIKQSAPTIELGVEPANRPIE